MESCIQVSTTLAPGLTRLLAALGGREPASPPSASTSAIDALRRQDPDTWRDLFTSELDAVYRYCFLRTGSASDAEDLASGVFEEAWRHADNLEDRGLPARAWLFGIARNIVNGHRRKLIRRAPHLALETYDAPEFDRGLDAELIDLARSVSELPGAQAEVITLRFIHGLSLAETADVLHTSVDAIKGRQARALSDLRERLGVALPGAGPGLAGRARA